MCIAGMRGGDAQLGVYSWCVCCVGRRAIACGADDLAPAARVRAHHDVRIPIEIRTGGARALAQAQFNHFIVNILQCALPVCCIRTKCVCVCVHLQFNRNNLP